MDCLRRFVFRALVCWLVLHGACQEIEAAAPPTRRVFTEHTDWVRSVLFVGKGTTFVSGCGCGDHAAIFWDLASGRPVHRLDKERLVILHVAVSPDGAHYLTASQDGTIKIRVTKTHKLLQTLDPFHEVLSAFFIPNTNRIASIGTDNELRLWDWKTGELVAKIVPHKHRRTIDDLAVSPKGDLLATSGGEYEITLWDSKTLKPVRALKGHREFVWSLAFDPTGEVLVSGARDGAMMVWDVKTGKAVKSVAGHNAGVCCLGFLPNGKGLLSSGRDARVILWDAKTWKPLKTYSGHTEAVRSVAGHASGRFCLSSGEDHTIRFWDLPESVWTDRAK